jgi:hypothetical protein
MRTLMRAFAGVARAGVASDARDFSRWLQLSGRGGRGYAPAVRAHSETVLFGGVRVRVIDAEITITTSAGRATARCRLITTLADPARYPAGEIIALYHERWVRHEVAWCEWNSQKEDRLMLVT